MAIWLDKVDTIYVIIWNNIVGLPIINLCDLWKLCILLHNYLLLEHSHANGTHKLHTELLDVYWKMFDKFYGEVKYYMFSQTLEGHQPRIVRIFTNLHL